MSSDYIEYIKTKEGDPYASGTVYENKRTKEVVVVLGEIKPYEDEENFGRKFVVRGDNHRKFQIFASELRVVKDRIKALPCPHCAKVIELDDLLGNDLQA